MTEPAPRRGRPPTPEIARWKDTIVAVLEQDALLALEGEPRGLSRNAIAEQIGLSIDPHKTWRLLNELRDEGRVEMISPEHSKAAKDSLWIYADPLYDGPDPFLAGVTAKWAAYLQTLPDVPRTIDAIIARIDDTRKAEAWLEIHSAEYGPAYEKALARWWRAALQYKSPEELQQIIDDIDSGKTKTVPAEDVFPGFNERAAAREARPKAERDADLQQAKDEQAHQQDLRDEQSETYLAALHQLVAQEHRYRALQHEDQRKRALHEPPYDT